ncbi:TetR/AcrR family transcriptional regulator [Nocardia jiangxiensis]|uniref:TetR/AcrR family transcriptional regulator n=1 Tax=Nocardia jiangxiensis TaxID=282685 RepID=A0ABW6SCL3_9NOCA|nr:TetR/AcrR family transcriptional regulator [Nocardia jiangxiensis]
MARQRGGTQPVPLSAQDIVEAALRIVERCGLDLLTVRAVAEELGVTPPAVHYHLRGGDDLADRVIEAVACRVEIAVDPEANWVDRYAGLVSSMDRTFLRYPGTGTRVLTASSDSAAARRLTGAALSILRTGGFGETEAVDLFTATYLMFAGWLATRGLRETGGTHPALLAAGVTAPDLADGTALDRALRRLLESAAAVRPGAGNQGNNPRDRRKR